MFSVLTFEKRNVSFSQFLCMASMLGWSLYLKIVLRVGSAMFFVTGSNSLYLEIFRFLTIFEKKFLRVSAVSDSAFNILPFSLILILSLMRDLSESEGFADFQSSSLSVTFFIFKFLWYPLLGFAKEIHSNSFAYYKEFYFLLFFFSESYCEVLTFPLFL